MLTASKPFVAALEKWIEAVKAEDLPLARVHAEFLATAGDLIAVHPDFIACLKLNHVDGMDSRETMRQMSQVISCVTDCCVKSKRARV